MDAATEDSSTRTEPAVLAELLYVQLYRILRRTMVTIGDLERGGPNPWQQVNRASRLLGSIDSDIVAARDLLENLAAKLQLELPKRSIAIEKAKGANSQIAPGSEPKPSGEHV